MAFVSYSMCNEDIMMRFVDFDEHIHNIVDI